MRRNKSSRVADIGGRVAKSDTSEKQSKLKNDSEKRIRSASFFDMVSFTFRLILPICR